MRAHLGGIHQPSSTPPQLPPCQALPGRPLCSRRPPYCKACRLKSQSGRGHTFTVTLHEPLAPPAQGPRQATGVDIATAIAAPLLLLVLAWKSVSWALSWLKAGLSATNPHTLSTLSTPSTQPHIKPAEYWAASQMQQQGLDMDGQPQDPAHPQGPQALCQVICCLRIPTIPLFLMPNPPSNTDYDAGRAAVALDPQTTASKALVQALSQCVHHCSLAPGAQPITGLLAAYPSCAILVLEGDSACVCALLRDILRPPSPASPPTLSPVPTSTPPTAASPSGTPASSNSPPTPNHQASAGACALGLAAADVRVLSFNPEARSRQYDDWYELKLQPTLPTLSQLKLGRGLPSSAPSPIGFSNRLTAIPTPTSSSGTSGLGSGQLSADALNPQAAPLLSEVECKEAAEAVGLFVNLLSAKLQGIPGRAKQLQLLDTINTHFPSLPSIRMVLGLATTEVAPDLRTFLDQYDVDYERYIALASSGELDQLERFLAEQGIDVGGGGAGQTGGGQPGATQLGQGSEQRVGGGGLVELSGPDRALVLDLQKLRYLYRRHWLLEQQQEQVMEQRQQQLHGGEAVGPLASFYPKRRQSSTS